MAISEWEGQFNELDGGDINFTVSSSVVGMNDFCNHTVDFGATDISYATGQADCSTSQVPYPFQYMPTVAGGLAFEFNLQGTNGQRITNLILNGQTLAGIFTGSIKNWNDPSIQALNPSVPLPNEPITAYLPQRPLRRELPFVGLLLARLPRPHRGFPAGGRRSHHSGHAVGRRGRSSPTGNRRA